MKNAPFHLFTLAICLSLMAFQCDEDIMPLTQEEERKDLNIYKNAIEDLAATSVCNETTECKYIAFGSKPCGGPWGYLIYTTSIDTKKLKLWVEDYNQRESNFNSKWDVGSDCSVVNPPISINCQNNSCIPIY
ncbi:hypothetical protein L3X37_00570 [Sabulilitoribacter arenilitoris]|uniref:Uncharacterized protein n=1 Tax=Wocania arenilitoris TaxID=2044858 RepID=A0AAE3JJD9_9FLAO|nr:hypothetical protein [Wocania arenilitoris]MCF7566858.1 hypothetical protein [Wocania arenilitoris]